MNKILIENITNCFVKRFETKPLLINSPGRINIIGEHTDYNQGFVFPAAIDKSIVTAIGKSNTHSCSAFAYDNDELIQFSLENITSIENGNWKNYVLGVVAEIQKKGKIVEPFNVAFGGDIPSGAGLSSSAALENSIVFGLNELFNLKLTKAEMILISQKAEHNYVGVKCGIMDQYASMFGKKNNALHLDCRTIASKPYEINFKDYKFILINTNVKHSLSDSAYNDRRSACESVSKMLGLKALREASENGLKNIENKVTPENYQKALYIIQEIERTKNAAKAIENNDLKTLGALIYASHNGLQHQYMVSCEELDFLVEQAKLNGHVLGARMMGGGFGGCTINLIAKDQLEGFKIQVSKAYQEKFNKDCSIYEVNLSDGTHIINN